MPENENLGLKTEPGLEEFKISRRQRSCDFDHRQGSSHDSSLLGDYHEGLNFRYPQVLETKEKEPMAKQIVGYYTSRKEALLKDFERTSALMKDTLVGRFGEKFKQELREKVRKEYEAFIPDIPFMQGGGREC